MAENFDINIFLAAAPIGKARRQFVEQLFRELAHWLGRPRSLAINVLATGDFHHTRWPAGALVLEEPPNPAVLLHVYGRMADAGRASLTIDETPPSATYVVALPNAVVRQSSDAEVDETLTRLFELTIDVSPGLVLAGVEIAIDARGKDMRQVVNDEMAIDTDVELVVGPKRLLSSPGSHWQVLRSSDSSLALRRRKA